MLLGRSYWHQPQGLGLRFHPGRLEGYFSDLRCKAQWNGLADNEGLPMVRGERTEAVYFPTTVFQKGLAHWDLWLLSDKASASDFASVLAAAEWATRQIDGKGGWKCWDSFGVSARVPYNAMAQGEGISLLVRAYDATRDVRYLDAATRAIELLFRDEQDGGVSRDGFGGVVLEEVPVGPRYTILNGWIFALFGAYDYLLVVDDPAIRSRMTLSLAALVRALPEYNDGRWSRYDLSGSLASPFYHNLHVAQLVALEQAFPDVGADIARTRKIFQAQAGSSFWKAAAVCRKAVQKIANPPEYVVH